MSIEMNFSVSTTPNCSRRQFIPRSMISAEWLTIFGTSFDESHELCRVCDGDSLILILHESVVCRNQIITMSSNRTSCMNQISWLYPGRLNLFSYPFCFLAVSILCIDSRIFFKELPNRGFFRLNPISRVLISQHIRGGPFKAPESDQFLNDESSPVLPTKCAFVSDPHRDECSSNDPNRFSLDSLLSEASPTEEHTSSGLNLF